MAFTSNKNLKHTSTVNLRDYTHASDTFVADQFRLAPKTKFLFHVSFNINLAALKNPNLVQRYGNEINLLVKAVDLPSYTVQTEVLNQYNRKKVVQYTHKPGEIQIKFHDDNMGLINQLWQNYYSYYYADSTSAKTTGSYNRNATRSSDFIQTPYGLDNNSTQPFFNYIKVYQMARHEFVSYTLINPIITSWNHNKLDYARGNETNDFDMKLMYEAVTYDVGQVTPETVEGFSANHYDNMTSPLEGVNPDPSVFSPSFVQSLNVENIAPSVLSNTINTVNNYQNTKLPTTVNGTPGIINTQTLQTATSVNGIAFPTASTTANTTIANPVNIT